MEIDRRRRKTSHRPGRQTWADARDPRSRTDGKRPSVASATPSRGPARWAGIVVTLGLIACIDTSPEPADLSDVQPRDSGGNDVIPTLDTRELEPADAVSPDAGPDDAGPDDAGSDDAGSADLGHPDTDSADVATPDAPPISCGSVTAPGRFVCLEGGAFTMGAPPDEVGTNADETVHEVTITRQFLLQSTEVTQRQWRSVMGTDPSYFDACGGNCPVERVSWWDAVAYTNALSRAERLDECYVLSGCSGVPGGGCDEGDVVCNGDYECSEVRFVGLDCNGYRLPTESEWEFAARAGVTAAAYGNPDEIAWHTGNSDERTHRVGTQGPNAWALYDMLGNVWEWTWDWYGVDAPDSAVDPLGPEEGTHRTLRGASWFQAPRHLRAANRYFYPSTFRGYFLGFRPARSAAE